MTSPASGPDRPAGHRRVRRGRVSALVLGTILASTVALIAMVAWPSLWWDIATNVKPPSPLPARESVRSAARAVRCASAKARSPRARSNGYFTRCWQGSPVSCRTGAA